MVAAATVAGQRAGGHTLDYRRAVTSTVSAGTAYSEATASEAAAIPAVATDEGMG
jgi:hypothetical protein